MELTIEVLALILSAAGFIWKAAKLQASIDEQIKSNKTEIKREIAKQEKIFLENFETLQRHYAEKYREVNEVLERLKVNEAATYSFRKETNRSIQEINKHISTMNAQIELMINKLMK